MYRCMLLSCLSAVNGFLLGKGRSLVLQNWGHFISIIDGSKMSVTDIPYITEFVFLVLMKLALLSFLSFR